MTDAHWPGDAASARPDDMRWKGLRVSRSAAARDDTVIRMSAQPADWPADAEPFEVIHLGGETAAIVPLSELLRLRAIERHALPEIIEEAVGGLAAESKHAAALCVDAVKALLKASTV